VGLWSLGVWKPIYSQELSPEELVSAIRQKWSTIQDFQADMTIGVQFLGTLLKIEGTVWQKERLFRAKMLFPPELMPQMQSKEGTSQVPPEMLIVFDGKAMWQSMPMLPNLVMKTDFSSLEGKAKEVITPRALYNLPDLSYRVSEKNREGVAYYLLETGDVTQFLHKSVPPGMGINIPKDISFNKVCVWVNKATLFPELIEGFTQGDTPAFYLQFKNLKVNQGLPQELFLFQIPEGAQIMDMTAMMKAMTEKMKSP